MPTRASPDPNTNSRVSHIPRKGSSAELSNCPAPAGTLTLSVAQVAKHLGISKSHFYDLMKEGAIGPSPVRLGGSVRFRATEIAAWVEAGCPSLAAWKSNRPSTIAAQQEGAHDDQ